MSRKQRVLLLATAMVGGATHGTIRAAEPVRFDQLVAVRRPHLDELDAESLLAEAGAAAVGGGGVFLEAPTTSVVTGPRHSQDETEPDLVVEVEVPLIADRHRRLDLASALDGASDAIRSWTRAIALADLASAYARAWLAQAEVQLRRQDVSVAEAWLAATQQRIEAGADPPYESLLVAGERDRARLDLIAAGREVELTWGELARFATIAPEPQALDLASLPGADLARGSAGGDGAAVLAGIEARRKLMTLLASARSAAVSSRWAVAGDAGREGDERLARVGVAYRFPLPGERASIVELERAASASAAADAVAEAVELRARIAAAHATLEAPLMSLTTADYDEARRALDLRVAEGKERASQVLPLRRQLLEAALARVETEASRAQAAAELFFLDGGDLP